MKVTILQPAYLPWLGFFHRVFLSDVLIVLDNVAMDRNSKTKFANRNKIRTHQGWTWLTIPLVSKGKSDEMFLDHIATVGDGWEKKHWSSIRGSYAKAPHWRAHAPFLESLYAKRHELLIDACRGTTNYLLDSIGIARDVRYASEMSVAGAGSDLILNLCVAAGAKQYISGPFGRDYLSREKFDAAGIDLRFHDYAHPTYAQLHGGFEPYMSALDLLLNHGPEAQEILSRNHPNLPTT